MTTSTLPLEQPDLESSTEQYARRFAGSVGGYFLRVQREIVHSMLQPADHRSLLDVGGGHAQLSPSLVDAGYEVTVFGSDDSCKQRLDSAIGTERYQFVSGNLLALPFADDSFDVVLAFRMLPHLKNWQGFVAELCRVATKCVIVDYPTLKSFNWFSNRLFALKKRVEENTRPYQCFRDAHVAKAFHTSGFRVAQSKGQFLLPMALHRLVNLAWFSHLSEALASSMGLTHFFGSPVILKTHLICD